MKKSKILLVLLIFGCYQIVAQNNDAATYFAKYITALKYSKGDGLPQNKEKAFKIMKECAEAGEMEDAMLVLGAMYMTGSGTQKSEDEAYKWILKSSKGTNPKAMYALGKMYKDGTGTEQDFVKARDAFEKAAQKGEPGAQFMTGMMLHRGLGGTQNYEEAVKWFSLADENGNADAAYMLGVCYKNGYGVTQDYKKSNDFLTKASKKGNKNAQREKKSDKPEVNKNRDEQYRNHIASKNHTSINYIQEKVGGNISGEWTGKQYTLDWSHTHIIEETNTKLIIHESDGSFTGEWYENEQLLVDFSGKIIDKIMMFDKTEFMAPNRHGEMKGIYFTKGKLEMLSANKKYLAGEIETYNVDAKEPGYPVYVVLENTIKQEDENVNDTLINKAASIEEKIADNKNTTIDSSITKKENQVKATDNVLSVIRQKETEMSVYPNPFDQSFTVSYNLENAGTVILNIYNSNGGLVLQQELKGSTVGKNSKQITFQEVPGTYIIVLEMNGHLYSKVVIKK